MRAPRHLHLSVDVYAHAGPFDGADYPTPAEVLDRYGVTLAHRSGAVYSARGTAAALASFIGDHWGDDPDEVDECEAQLWHAFREGYVVRDFVRRFDPLAFSMRAGYHAIPSAEQLA